MWRRFRSWLRTMAHRSQTEHEMDAELHFHIDAFTEDLVRTGVPREEAVRRARIEFGGVERAKEECRDACGVNLIESLLQDLRFGLRMLRKNPGFSAVAVVTLALGIGATTAIFSVVNAVLLKPLAIEEPSNVFLVQEQWRNISPGLSVGNFIDVRQQDNLFANLCASNNGSFNLVTRETPQRVDGEIVTANYFATFGVQPIAGRVFTNDEAHPGHSQVVLISERLWRSLFHADPRAIRTNVAHEWPALHRDWRHAQDV